MQHSQRILYVVQSTLLSRIYNPATMQICANLCCKTAANVIQIWTCCEWSHQSLIAKDSMLCLFPHKASGGLGASTPLSCEEQRFLRMSALRLDFQWVNIRTPWFCRIQRWWKRSPMIANSLLFPPDLYLRVLALHKTLDFDWRGSMDL